MKTSIHPTIRRAVLVAVLSCAGLLSGCATDKAPTSTLFDLGPLPAASAAQPTSLPAVSVAEVIAPVWLDTQLMYYRLSYANDQQPRPYADSRWSMPPALLFGQRLKARIAQR